MQSSPRDSSPASSPAVGSSTGRPSSPTPPGGPKTAIRRRAAADQKDKVANTRPSSTRAAGAGGSSSTMLSRFLFSLSLLSGRYDVWLWLDWARILGFCDVIFKPPYFGLNGIMRKKCDNVLPVSRISSGSLLPKPLLSSCDEHEIALEFLPCIDYGNLWARS